MEGYEDTVLERHHSGLIRLKQSQLKCTAIKGSRGQSWYLGHRRKLGETEVQRVKDKLDHYPFRPETRTDTSTPQYRAPNRYGQKRIYIHTKNYLGVQSLGQPAEALVVQTAEKSLETSFFSRNPEKIDPTERPSSVDEILNKIQTEKEKVSAGGVAKNLEDLRDVWAVSRISRNKSPTAEECKDLVETICRGFSRKQLYGYYSAGCFPVPDPSNIELPYSTKLYTRSSWTPGSTTFPGNAHFRLRSARLSAGARAPTKSSTSSALHGLPLVFKRVLVEKILSERWGLRSRQDEEALGELEIWFQYEHICLLMNHSRDILRRLSERYGAKIDASRSLRFLRVTSDRGTCTDVLKFLLYVVQRIESEDIELQSGQEPSDQDFTQPNNNMMFWEELQQLTNTVITPVSEKPPYSKATMYYLGPSKEDLVDARRLLLRSRNPNTDLDVSVYWGGASKNAQIVASPVEVDDRLPLADRGQQWSRWALAVKREDSIKIPREPDIARSERRKRVLNILKSQDVRDELQADVSHKVLRHWPKSTQQNGSFMIGHALYPTKMVNDLQIMAHRKTGKILSGAFKKRLDSPHQFLTLNLGLQASPLGSNVGKLIRNDDLRIYLTPKSCENYSAEPTIPLPDLEIRVAVSQAQRTTALGSARLIFKKREADLLMPDQLADLRFITEMYAIFDNLSGVPQELDEFLASSNLDVWGTDRLKTPPGLRLPIPKYCPSEASSTGLAKSQVAPTSDLTAPIYVDYAFTSLEHRSNLVELQAAHNLVYSIIEAGRTGGRREELLVTAQGKASKNQGMILYEAAQKMITSS
ncbi:MAG: hypothetical protein Q9191_005285 [Dirinaria sp. TL-2023a]